jgi:hypothetical protein
MNILPKKSRESPLTKQGTESTNGMIEIDSTSLLPRSNLNSPGL